MQRAEGCTDQFIFGWQNMATAKYELQRGGRLCFRKCD